MSPSPISLRSRFASTLLPLFSVALSAGSLCRADDVIVTFGGQTFVNHGLVGVGRIPANTKDKFGETFGSFSAFSFQPGSWRRNLDGSYSGTLFTQPDRGYNAANTTNYVPRFNQLALTFQPAPAGAAAQNQVALTIADTVKYTEADGTPLTSLDPTNAGTRPGFPALPQAYNGRLCLDAEGIVVNRDGTLWVSDEYGPYIYKFASNGRLLAALRPPEALIPRRNGADSFASNTPGVGQSASSPANPDTGRQNNQGLEGLSLSPDGRTLFALLQSAARQDGGTGGSSAVRFNTRLLAYDLTGAAPTLIGEYVLQLPTFTEGTGTRVAAQSDLLALTPTQFLVITRDSGNGHGLTPTSLYRTVNLYDITSATNLAGSVYDQPGTPLAPAGTLAAGIVPARRAVLIDLNATDQLAKFGLHNGPTDDINNLSEKWEALALVPALDPGAPDDYFLFVGNDNDFMTAQGFQDGAAYNAGNVENDSMILVYRLTLPGRLLNSSSRALTGAGDSVHIAGFVVAGAKPKTLLIRGVGPGLLDKGVPTALADPVLSLYDGTGRLIAANDNWSDAANLTELTAASAATGAFPLAPGSKDAALILSLSPGAYSAHVSAGASGTGVSLIELYEVP